MSSPQTFCVVVKAAGHTDIMSGLHLTEAERLYLAAKWNPETTSASLWFEDANGYRTAPPAAHWERH